MPRDEGGGSKGNWEEWSRHVLAELERLNAQVDEARKDIQSMRVDLAMLNVKAGAWGVLGGFIPIAIAIAMAKFK